MLYPPHIVLDDQKDSRFVDYSIGLFPEVPTKNAVKKQLKKGALLLNGNIAKSGDWVQKGDRIDYQEVDGHIPKEYWLDVPVIYEDDHCVIVNKPSGIVVSGNLHRTLTNALIGKFSSNQVDAYKWVRPIHRLDAATSGLVLFAKTRIFHRYASDLFRNREVDKSYVAIVQGEWIKEHIISMEVDGKEAVSVIAPLRVVKSLRNKHLTLLKLIPKTGRTHQLRIHCANSGFPIVGDKVYGVEGEVMKHKGLFLCAYQLKFKSLEEKLIHVEIPIPKKFDTLLASEQRRWEARN
ncbi:MAG: RluA family pseudouridine synthase [Crocinitomicaceae bacterium]|nr:RluA family pseudouridine synthase [Crocinitomicaceae bacterium]